MLFLQRKTPPWSIVIAAFRGHAAGSFAILQFINTEPRSLSRLMKSNYSNIAQLKDLMTVPPMTAAQHAEVMRKRIEQRRMVEEAKELKKANGWQFETR